MTIQVVEIAVPWHNSRAHHAFSRNQRFPDAARKARHSRALSRGLLSLLREAYVDSAVLAALSLASKFRPGQASSACDAAREPSFDGCFHQLGCEEQRGIPCPGNGGPGQRRLLASRKMSAIGRKIFWIAFFNCPIGDGHDFPCGPYFTSAYERD